MSGIEILGTQISGITVYYLLALLFTIYCTVNGWKKGFLYVVFGLISWIVCFGITYFIYQPVGTFLTSIGLIANVYGTIPYEAAVVVAPLLILVSSFLIAKIICEIVRSLLRGIKIIPVFGFVNSTLGLVAGFVEGVFISWIGLQLIYMFILVG